MLIIRGVNVFPSQIEELVLQEERLSPHYMLEVSRDGRMDELAVMVEMKPQYAPRPEPQAEVKKHLAHRIQDADRRLGGHPHPGSRRDRRSVGKAKRVIDKRPK